MPGGRCKRSDVANEAKRTDGRGIRWMYAPGLFQDQVVVITGGGSGIGLASAREIAHLGGKVAILGRRAEKIEAALGQLRDDGHADEAVFGAPCDIRDP